MSAQSQELEAQYWVKTRSSLDPSESTFLIWTGKIYSFIPEEEKKLLFKMIGMSVSRCIATEEGHWDFVSRELTYYLHPETEEIIQKWENPWIGETVSVLHVANNPVQGHFKGKFLAQVERENTTFVFDIFPTYPNPLAKEAKFAKYSPYGTYQAAELFKLTVLTPDLFNPELTSVSKLNLTWDRIGQWLPWMKMGDRPGNLIYSAVGKKVGGLSELPQLLQNEINHRVPLYKQAPKVFSDQKDMTSWLYFQKHFDAYLANEIFPLHEAEEG